MSHDFVAKLEKKTIEERKETITLRLDEDMIPYRLQRVQQSDEVSDNIIITIKGRTARKIIIGAHYDPYPGAGGANDNGSGVSVLYSLIKHFYSQHLEVTVDFVFFTWEETDMLGSKHYVSTLTDHEDIIGMINLDMCGTGEILVFDHKNLPEALLPQTCKSVCEKLDMKYHSMVWLPPGDDCQFEKVGIFTISIAIIPPEYKIFVERLGKATHPKSSIRMKLRNLPLLVPTLMKESPFIKVMHRPTDTADKVTETALKRVYDVVAAMIVQLN